LVKANRFDGKKMEGDFRRFFAGSIVGRLSRHWECGGETPFWNLGMKEERCRMGSRKCFHHEIHE
jgi:hypothetical protein